MGKDLELVPVGAPIKSPEFPERFSSECADDVQKAVAYARRHRVVVVEHPWGVVEWRDLPTVREARGAGGSHLQEVADRPEFERRRIYAGSDMLLTPGVYKVIV